jgi:hypothetical protein
MAPIFSDRPSQKVSLLGCKAGHRLRHPQHLLLINDIAHRLFQHRFQEGMSIFHRRSSKKALQEKLLHTRFRSTGANQGQGQCHIIERFGPHGDQQSSQAGRLDLKDADGPAATEKIIRFGIIVGNLVGTIARLLPDDIFGLLDRRQSALAQKIDLHQAEVIDRIHIILGDSDPLGRKLQRHEIK